MLTPPGLRSTKLAWPRKVRSSVPGAVAAASSSVAGRDATAGEQPAARAGAARATRTIRASSRTVLAAAFIDQPGMAVQPSGQIGDDIGDGAGARQRQPSSQQGKIAAALAMRCRFDDGVERAFVAVAKHRERRLAVLKPDGIVAPLAAHDLTAVQGQKLIKLAPAKKGRPGLTSGVAEADDSCHRMHGFPAPLPPFDPSLSLPGVRRQGVLGRRKFISLRRKLYGSQRLAARTSRSIE